MKIYRKSTKLDKREVMIGNESMNKKLYEMNYVRTTKYTAINFLPKCLFNQFRNYANIYFLITAILQTIPQISPLAPISAIAPLLLVLSVSLIRESFEDIQRYKSDLETNSQTCFKLIKSSWV